MSADADAPAPPDAPLETRWSTHVLLFALTFASCWLAGGPVFAATLMTILTAHEMGHYVVARRHGVDVSPPYFIPLPFIGMGTLGAVIRMRAPITRRDQLIDVGAAGPLAGLVVAIPLLVVGLAVSPVLAPDAAAAAGGYTEGNSILYAALKYAVHGRFLPDGAVDVQLSPMALAAWMGLMLTFINLLPIGQLDGGHIATAFFGERHERQARGLHALLPVVAVGVTLALTLEAHDAGRTWGAALGYGASGALPWLVWTVLLVVLRRGTAGRYHPPVDEAPLSPSRRRLFWLMVVVFALIFTPVPMRETLTSIAP